MCDRGARVGNAKVRFYVFVSEQARQKDASREEKWVFYLGASIDFLNCTGGILRSRVRFPLGENFAFDLILQ